MTHGTGQYFINVGSVAKVSNACMRGEGKADWRWNSWLEMWIFPQQPQTESEF